MSFTKVRDTLGRGGLLSVAVVYTSALVMGTAVLLIPAHASAAQLSQRKLTLSSSANGTISTDAAGNAVAAGNGGNGAKAKHTFDFTTSGASIGSIEFLYCTTPLPGTTCTAPTGMSAATVTSVGGTSNSGWSLGTSGNAPTANSVRIQRASAAAATTLNFILGAGGSGTDYIKNPTVDNTTFFVRITTFSDTGYTTTSDQGTVANSTAQEVNITAKVQETLNFSVGTTVTAPNGSTCTPFSDTGNLALGDTNGVLSFATAYAKNSYFRISTNATNGTLVYYSGDTLKSGANSIASVGLTANGTSSTPGTAQFGLAVDSSDTQSGSGYSFTSLAANNGANVAGHAYNYSVGAGTITNAGTAKFQYDVASVSAPDPIAKATGIIACDTGSVRYLGNISANTPAGIYTTTVTYLAVPTY